MSILVVKEPAPGKTSESLCQSYFGRLIMDGNRLRNNDLIIDGVAIVHFKNGYVHGSPAVEAIDGSGQVENWRDGWPSNHADLAAIMRPLPGGGMYREFWKDRILTDVEGRVKA